MTCRITRFEHMEAKEQQNGKGEPKNAMLYLLNEDANEEIKLDLVHIIRKHSTRKVDSKLLYKVLELLSRRAKIVIIDGYITGISKLVNYAEQSINK